ncbi:hypothetical protein HYU18_00050, partial [Candidatus Woesearchaeota archaeon]|nr:hypothetical protein [Candidatus Woesearchaeota archaeon]
MGSVKNSRGMFFFVLMVAALLFGSMSALAVDTPKTFYFHSTAGPVAETHLLSETVPATIISQITSVMSTTSPGFRLFHPGTADVQHVFDTEPAHVSPSAPVYWVSDTPFSGTFAAGVWTFTIHKSDNIGGEFSKPHINVYGSQSNADISGASFLFHAEGPDWWNNNVEQIAFSIAADALQFDSAYLVVQLYDHCIADCNAGKRLIVSEDGVFSTTQTKIETPVFTAASVPDTVAPVVTMLSPPTSYNSTASVRVRASVIDDALANVMLRILQGETIVREQPMALEAGSSTVFSTFVVPTFETPQLPDGLYTFRVDALDASSNLGSASVPVTIDSVKPSLQVIEPLPFAELSGEFTIKATASDALTGVENISYRLTNTTKEAVGWTLLPQSEPGVWSGLLNPAALADGRYTVSVSVRDFAGNSRFIDTVVILNKAVPVPDPAPSPSPSPLPSDSPSTPVGLSAVSPLHPVNGYPVWFQDGVGMAVEQCFDPANQMCLADPVIAGNAFSEEIGFGSEAFWWTTEALMEINAPIPGKGASGNALIVLALEAAFANEDPAPGEQMSFGRVRFFIDAPVAGTYRITYPFGVKEFEVLVPGPRAIKLTDDVGCVPVPAAGITCDHSLAFFSGIGPFLRWDTDFPVTGPDGRKYLGNPLIDHTITGSPFGTNFFRIEGPAGSNVGGPGVDTLETSLFGVSGRIADTIAPFFAEPAEVSPAVVEAGQAVTISAHLVDDLSGIGKATIGLGPLGLADADMALSTGTLLDGAWSLRIPGLSTTGAFVLPVTVTDRTGNLVQSSVSLTLQDTTQPAVVLSGDHPDSIVRDADTVLITATFTEATAIDEAVPPTVSIGDLVANAAMTKVSNKVWTFAWDVPSGNAPVSVSVTARDTSGNPAAAATGQASFTIDNLAPLAPSITSPSAAVVVNADAIAIAGTAEAGSLVRLQDSTGTIIASQQLGSLDTAFSFVAPLAQNAFNIFTLMAVDVAGNEGVLASVPTIIEDTDGVAVSLSYSPNRNVRGSDTLLITANFATIISIDESLANAPRISIDYAGEGLDVLDAVMSKASNLVWAYSADIPAGGDGIAAVTISARNTNGDLNHPATNGQFTVDNTLPPAPIVELPSDAAAVNLASYSIAGSAEAGALVRVYNGTMMVALQQLASGETGYSIAVPLVQNSLNVFNVTATDEAGNEGPVADVPAITQDSKAPIITAVAVSSVSESTATITWLSDELSSSMVFYGTTTATLLNTSVNGATVSHSVALTGLSAATPYFFNVSSCDAAGNCNTSVQSSFTTSAPPAPPGSSGGSGGGSSGGGGGGGGGGSAAASLSSETVAASGQSGVVSSFSFD